MNAPPPSLAAAYERCRQIHADHGRTYYLATRLLPRERRPHVWALYAFARTADELVDGPHPDPQALRAFGDRAADTMASPHPPDAAVEPVLAATWHTMATYGLDPGLLQELLASMAMDLTISRYPTWPDLRRYMRGSAAVIGELTAPILGARGPVALRHAGRLGEAFQLTNFVRDVSEDYERGRVYLPGEDLARCGVSEAMLAAAVATGQPSPQVRALVAFEVARARRLYDEAQPGLAMVDARAQPCLEAAFTLYRAILDHVADRDHNVFEGRLAVPTSQRVSTAARVALGAGARRLTSRSRRGGRA